MRLFYKITAYLTVLLGIVHTAFTPVFYNKLSSDALWFAGTGLALVYLGLANIFAEKVAKIWMLNTSIVANVLGSLFIILLVIILGFAPQSVVALLFFVGMTLGSILLRVRA
ncbi:MAG: hypothetical protein JXB07_03435 [Anaerolineae bacterium]|nr:hypothetical protein [Anaerolineae bacterium]